VGGFIETMLAGAAKRLFLGHEKQDKFKHK
jgi:hypothetical protein